MTFFAPFVLYLSCLLCAADAGVAMVGVCALLCLGMSFWITFLPVRVPWVLRLLVCASILCRLVLLWGDGGAKSSVFFALVVGVVALIAFDRKGAAKMGLLASGAVPFSFLALLCVLFCLCGRFALPQLAVPWEQMSLFAAVLFPMSVTLLLPSVRGAWYLPPAALAASCVAVLPVLFFSFPLWKNILCMVLLVFCAGCELRIVCGRAA